MTNHIMPTYYNQLQVHFEHGKGAWLWDNLGEKYLDGLAGIAVCSLGHAHPAVTQAIISQAEKLLHTSNTYIIPNQVKLANKLTHVAGMEQAYFCNSGAEANESAIKLTRLYARKKSITNPIVITMKNSFHGRTLATLSASGSERLQAGFEPLAADFKHTTLNDIHELDQLILTYQDRIIAIMLEPIQGDGGIQIASNEYLTHIRNLCDKHDWLMILDEVQTGIARTGKWFAYQHTNIKPDIITIAKALANGIPIGACLARDKACNLFGPGKHGSTFGGNPFACAVANTVLETIENENINSRAEKIGAYLLEKLKSTLQKYPQVKDVRGKGLMLGVELDRPCMEITKIALKNKILFNITSNTVIRLLPPLIITEQEADEIAHRVDITIAEFIK